jgi:hypothetical protein
MSEVTVPGIGGVKKEYVFAGGALVVGIVGWSYWNRSRQAASAAAAAGPTDAPLSTGSTTDYPAGTQEVTGNTQYAGTTSNPNQLTTNDQWANAAVLQLQNEGWDAVTVREAIGKYLDHEALNTSEQNIVRSAISAAGTPPVGTFTIIVGSDAPAPSAPAVPRGFHVVDVNATGFTLGWYADTSVGTYHLYEGSNLVGTDNGTYHPFTGRKPGTKYGPFYLAAVNAAAKEGTKAGPLYVTTHAAATAKVGHLRVTEVGSTAVTVLWTAAPNATSYRLYQDGRFAGPYHSTQASIHGLKPRSRHTFTVSAVGEDGHEGPKSSVTVTTKR